MRQSFRRPRLTLLLIKRLLLCLSILTSCYVYLNVFRTGLSQNSEPDIEETAGSTSVAPSQEYSCGYRAFPYPERHSGLPWLYDAFASNTAEKATFIGMHRGTIHPQFNEADNFLANKTTGKTHQFLCMFQGRTSVMSEPVHHIYDGKYPGNENLLTFLIHCNIPAEYRHLVVRGQHSTALKVDLYAIYDAEDSSHTARPVAEAPKILDIAICHPANLRPKQFTMIAHTRIRSAYQYIEGRAPLSGNYRIPDWIEYHKYQGFDHFVIVDNDHYDHGPIETILQPYIDSGLVTRLWNPMNESARYRSKSHQTCHTQGGASIAALHRFGFATKYFANMDIDEYFVPTNRNKTVLEVTKEDLGTDPPPNIDGVKWPSRVITYCNDTPVVLGSSELNKKCITKGRMSGPKQIFLADRIWLYHTHHAFLTSNLTKPKIKLQKEGYLAHFRNLGPGHPNSYRVWRGKAISMFSEPVDHFDGFLEYKATIRGGERVVNVSSTTTI